MKNDSLKAFMTQVTLPVKLPYGVWYYIFQNCYRYCCRILFPI